MKKLFVMSFMAILLSGCSAAKSSPTIYENKFDGYEARITFQECSEDPVTGWLEKEYEGQILFINPEVALDNSDIRFIHLDAEPFVKQPLKERIWEWRFRKENNIPIESLQTSLPEPGVLNMEFTPEGSDAFHKLTQENVGNKIAILLDGQIIIAAKVYEPIPFGQCQLSGVGSREDAQRLAAEITGNTGE